LKLQIFSTARAIRKRLESYKSANTLIPRLMRIDEFEKNIAIVPSLSLINPTQRVFFLREATDFQEFEKLKSQRELIKFFSKSEDFFKFFEELSWEMVEFRELIYADSYAEFEEHISILSKLKNNYRRVLEESGFTDRMFIPHNYTLNRAFIENFDSFELFLDGYLSRFELKLLQEVAEYREFFIHIRTTKYNRKMLERFSDIGIELPPNSKVLFELSSKRVISSTETPLTINAKVYSLQNRFEQISAIFGEVEEMIRDGISPENIAVVLPDESFAESLAIYDRLNNYNFAMGFEFKHTITYRKLYAISSYLKSFDNLEQLNFFKIDIEKLSLINSSMEIEIDKFFKNISSFEIENLCCEREEALKFIRDGKNIGVATTYLSFYKLFKHLKLPFREWLYLWLRELKSIRIDDIKGGRVTVMGVLETRGVEFEGVVICDFNEGLVPTISSKDRFLNSEVRRFAKLPTKDDRDSLQRYHYTSLMERAKSVVILYSNSNDMIASKFIYELKLPKPQEVKAPLQLLYKYSKRDLRFEDVEVEFFADRVEWSPTKLDVWIRCKRKFFYKYILKIEEKPSTQINAGTTLHICLKNLFSKYTHFLNREEFKRSFESELTLYDNFKEPTTYEYYKRVWLRSMDRFFTNHIEHFKMGWRVLECEKSMSGEIEGINFSGKVDRIDVSEESKAVLIDYKSGSVKFVNRTNLDRLSDFQMNIYLFLFSRQFDIEGLLFSELFDGGNLIALKDVDRKNELLLSHIDELKSTKSFVTERCDDLTTCRFCQYRVMCQRGEFI
jgi:RecB family exonuclease